VPVACALVAALHVGLSPHARAEQTATSTTTTTSPAQLPPKPSVVFDLAPSGGSEPVTLTAPRAQFFTLVLKNRAPSGSYRITYDWLLDPATRHRPPTGALHRQDDLPRTQEGELGLLHVSPACNELQARGHDVLRASDEQDLVERLAVYRAKEAEGGCPRLTRLQLGMVDSRVDLGLTPDFQLFEGDKLQFTVERRDPTTGTALRTWRFAVRPQPLALGWTYPNEEAWIVGETSRDIAEMVRFARDRSLPSGDSLGFTVEADAPPGATFPRYAVTLSPRGIAPREHLLSFEAFIWSPASYEPLAVALLQDLGLRAARPSPEGLVSDALTHPVSRILAQESKRLSQRLGQSMLDAGAHEQAALILGALALREGSGGLTDIRHLLCRMSAHMALARALRHGASSPTAGYAEALLLTLVNRQHDALGAIESLERASPAPAWAAFLRALRIRNTHDWRILREPARAALLEQLEHYRALQVSLGSSQALEFFEAARPEPLSDWGRITFQGSASVEQGHLFADSLLRLETEDAAEVWRLLHGKALPAGKLVEALNVRPQRLISAEEGGRLAPQVIGWGTWAAYYQRNVCFDASASVRFLESMLGLHDEARDRRADLDDELSALDLWWALTLDWRQIRFQEEASRAADARNAVDAKKMERDACARGALLAQNEPDRLPTWLWRLLDLDCEEARDMRLTGRWLVGIVPAGTLLTDTDRILSAREPERDRLYAALYERAPFHLFVHRELAPGGGDAPCPDLTTRYGPLADYDLRALRHLVSACREDTATVRSLYERMATLEPGTYLSLGDYLVDLGLEDEAAAAFEKAIEKARDRVAVSNSLQWLVGYYCDRSRTARAREVAQMAAAVYSARGLQTMAYVLERMGQYAEAEGWYQRVVERYGEDSRAPLDDFYIRYEHRVGDGRFAAEAKAALARVFPAGLERVSIAEMTSPPDPGEGVRVSGRSQRSTRFGLAGRDVVVALNGYRVHNGRQYGLLWTLDDGPEATVIIWRKDRYVEVKGLLKRIAYAPLSRPI
jgi:tetratricopeptide (TPR) repeat protein